MGNRVQIKFDKLAPEYAAKYEHPSNILGFEKMRRLELLVDYALLIKPENTLDAGCGSGVVLSALKDRLVGSAFVGVDLSYLMLQQAQASSLADVPLVQSLVEQLPFADESFDLIYALGVIDYVEDLQQFFKVAWRILKPRGYFIFSYPNEDSINRSLRNRLSKAYLRCFGRSNTVDSAVPTGSSIIDRLVADNDFEWFRRHCITYGNGLVSFPWSVTLSRSMENWCNERSVSRYLAWTYLCVVRKRAE